MELFRYVMAYNLLQSIRGKSVTLTNLKSGESWVGPLRSISTPVSELPDEGSIAPYSLVTVRGVRQ